MSFSIILSIIGLILCGVFVGFSAYIKNWFALCGWAVAFISEIQIILYKIV